MLIDAKNELFTSLDNLKQSVREGSLTDGVEFNDVLDKGVAYAKAIGAARSQDSDLEIKSLFSPNIGRLNRQEVVKRFAPNIPLKDFVYAPYVDGFYLSNPDTTSLITPISDASNLDNVTVLDSSNIVLVGDQGPNGFAMVRAFNYDTNSVAYWRSGRANRRSDRHHLGIFYPNPMKPTGLEVIGGSTTNNSIAFHDGKLQGCTTPWEGGLHTDYDWEDILNIGDLNVDSSTGILPLNLTKRYYGFRLSMEGANAISYYYARVRSLLLLS